MRYLIYLGLSFLIMAPAWGQAQETSIDIPALHESTLNLFEDLHPDDIPMKRVVLGDKYETVPLDAADITEGVISDYITMIKFMVGRKELAENLRTPLNPRSASHYILQRQKASRIIYHHKAYHSFETNGHQTFPKYEEKVVRFRKDCIGECAKILFEDRADSIIYVSIHPETRKIIPESILEFRKGKKCEDKLSDGASYVPATHSLPALGLCIDMTKPKASLELVKSDGLHLYDTFSSPFWPEEIESDYIAVAPSRSRIPSAFENLEHTKTSGSITHKAMGIQIGGVKGDLTISYEKICLSVTPALPRKAIEHLIIDTAGDKFLDKAYRNDSPLIIEDGSICHGKIPEKDHRGFFKYWDTANGKIEFASIFSPKQIEESLRTSMKIAQSKGENADAEWASIAEAIGYLQQYHPGFKNDIAHRIAPIIVEVAKYDLTRKYGNILAKMPHKSMEPYLEDLILIFGKTITSLGCEDMKCPKEGKGSKPILWNLAEIFSGAGPKAADFLDKLQLANEEVGGSMGASWFTIGGGYKAAACIGKMGPEMERWISSRAYRTSGTDNKVSLDGVLSLRMTDQSEKARKHVEFLVESLSEKIKDPSLKPSWAKTAGLYNSIKSAKITLLSWDNSKPYCPARGDY